MLTSATRLLPKTRGLSLFLRIYEEHLGSGNMSGYHCDFSHPFSRFCLRSDYSSTYTNRIKIHGNTLNSSIVLYSF